MPFRHSLLSDRDIVGYGAGGVARAHGRRCRGGAGHRLRPRFQASDLVVSSTTSSSGSSAVLPPGLFTVAAAHVARQQAGHCRSDRARCCWLPAEWSTPSSGIRPSSTRHAWAHFRVEDSARLPDPATWPLVRDLSTAPVLDGICSYLIELSNQPLAAAQPRSAQFLAVLLDLFVRGPLAERPLPTAPPLVMTAMDAARRIWQADGVRLITVDELARAASISAGHLYRIFREHYGCGPAHALELIRLSRAAMMVQRSNASLADVARAERLRQRLPPLEAVLRGVRSPAGQIPAGSADFGSPGSGAGRRTAPGGLPALALMSLPRRSHISRDRPPLGHPLIASRSRTA